MFFAKSLLETHQPAEEDAEKEIF